MYPKQAGRQRSNSNSRTGAREQLAELLLNKFRNRYSISAATERDLDASLQKEISRVVKQEASVTERDLNELDKKIKDLVHETRSQEFTPKVSAVVEPTLQKEGDTVSIRSRRSVAPSVHQSENHNTPNHTGLDMLVFDID